MDKKSFEIVLDEIRKCVLTEQRIKAIEHVHGYFSSEQVTEMLKYFSWAEPQIKAVKALQHKMVAVPTTKVVNILNCLTFTKDKLIVLELIALNISDAHNYRPIEDLFRFHLSEKKRCRRILEQASKVGCKAPLAMISSCGMIPGNPYPQGKPSLLNGVFPGTPAKKENDDNNSEGKGIAARILGSYKPAPSTYNPHKPVPYPIPPCRPHATIAPSAYNNAGLVSVGGVITASVPPPPYGATQNTAALSRSASQQSHTSSAPSTTFSPHGSNPPTPVTPVPAHTPSGQPPPTTPIAPVFPGLVPVPLPSPCTSTSAPSVIKGPPLTASPQLTPSPSGHSTPIPQGFPGISPSLTPTPSVIKSHTPSGTPCVTTVPNGSYTSGMSRSATPSVTLTPKGSSISVPHTFSPQNQLPPSTLGSADPSPSGSLGIPTSVFKGFPSSDAQVPSSFSVLPPPAASPAQSQSVIRSYTPSATPTPQGSSTPGMPVFSSQASATTPTPKPSAMHSQNITVNLAGAVNPLYGASGILEQHVGVLARQSGGSSSSNSSSSSSPVPSAFKGPSRSSTPSLSSLVMPNSAALALNRSLGLNHSSASVQATLTNSMAMAGLQGLSALGTQPGANPATLAAVTAALSGHSGFPGAPSLPVSLTSNPSASSSSAQASATSSAMYSGLPPSAAASLSPFGLGLSTPVSSIFPGLAPGPLGSGNAAFPGFAASNSPAGSPVLSSFMGLPGQASSVATVAPLQAAAVAAAAAAAAPSSAPVLPGFASAFSSNFNPALVAQAGLTTGLQPAGGAAFPGLLSFPAIPSFSPSASPAALSGLHNSAVQSALLQAHSASALESFPAQPNGFTNYPSAPGTPFTLQPGLHPQLGWQ
ncbi:proline and serine-rich protein 1 isoform X2 [Lepisosteus oculatus]|uniref:proline and serine-rich protein 1 isoform X2 n=1 Tax=Lepisosteus oculatus TaxID=7918 RepID=UPI003714F901